MTDQVLAILEQLHTAVALGHVAVALLALNLAALLAVALLVWRTRR